MSYLSTYSYNGYLPQGDRGRRRSKFLLYKRNKYNGVKRSKHYIVQSPETSQAILDANQHSISYTLSRNQAVIVEYQEDENTDMFQVNICHNQHISVWKIMWKVFFLLFPLYWEYTPCIYPIFTFEIYLFTSFI